MIAPDAAPPPRVVDVVWENERWGLDPQTRTARFGAEFLLPIERARFVSERRVLAAVFVACFGDDAAAAADGAAAAADDARAGRGVDESRRGVDDAFWDGAALPRGRAWAEGWHVNNIVGPGGAAEAPPPGGGAAAADVDGAVRVVGAPWLYGVNFSRDAASLSPVKMSHHFVRSRRWVRASVPGEARPAPRPGADGADGAGTPAVDGSGAVDEDVSFYDACAERRRRAVRRALMPLGAAAFAAACATAVAAACVPRRLAWSCLAVYWTALAACIAAPRGRSAATAADARCDAAVPPDGGGAASLDGSAAAAPAAAPLDAALALLLMPLGWCASRLGRLLLEWRLTFLFGSRCDVAAFEVAVDAASRTVVVTCAGVVVFDPTHDDTARPVVRLAAAAGTIGWAHVYAALTSPLQKYDRVDVSGLRLRLESVHGRTFRRLNCDYVARPPGHLDAVRCRLRDRDADACADTSDGAAAAPPRAAAPAGADAPAAPAAAASLIFGSLGATASDRACEAFEQCRRTALRLGDLKLVPRCLRHSGAPEAQYDVRKIRASNVACLVGASVLEDALRGVDDGHVEAKFPQLRDIWGDAAALDFGAVHGSSREALLYCTDAADAAADARPAGGGVCSATDMSLYCGALMQRQAQRALIEAFVLRPAAQGRGVALAAALAHFDVGDADLEAYAGEAVLSALVPDALLKRASLNRDAVRHAAKLVQPLVHVMRDAVHRVQADAPIEDVLRDLVDKRTPLGGALEGLGVDTDALALGANGNRGRLEEALRAALSALEDRAAGGGGGVLESEAGGGEQSLATKCIAALTPLLRAARAALLRRWRDDAEAMAAAAALDAALLELDLLRRAAVASWQAAAAPSRRAAADASPLAAEADEEVRRVLQSVDVDRVLAACSEVAAVSARLERFATPELLEELALAVAAHTDAHVLAALADKSVEMLLASFARLPVGALQGDAHQPYLGHLRYSVRHIDLSDVRVDKRKLDVRIRSADLATAARRGATRRPRAGGDADGGDESDGGNWSDDELMAPSAEPEVPRRAPRGPPVAAAVRLDGGAAGGPAAAHEFSAAPAVRPLAKLMKPASARVAPEGPRELLRLVLRDVELPLAGLKWAFAQSQWPYAADAGVAAAALHGLCVTVTLAALPRPGSPAEPRLCIAEVSVAVQRVELLVEGTLLSSLYNAAASALSSQLRDYVQDALEAALRAEADLRLRDVDDYLRQHHLWPLIFALAKVDRAVDRAADAGHGAAGRPERASPAAGRSERASPAAGAGGAAAPDAAEGRTAAGPAPRPGDAADDAWRVEALRPDVPAELWPLDDARDDRRVRH